MLQVIPRVEELEVSSRPAEPTAPSAAKALFKDDGAAAQPLAEVPAVNGLLAASDDDGAAAEPKATSAAQAQDWGNEGWQEDAEGAPNEHPLDFMQYPLDLP